MKSRTSNRSSRTPWTPPREEAYLRTQGHVGPLPPAAYLAISGGGDDGAFGAGFLNGWTQAGTRLQFKLVTGISTGALIAPFAFRGSAYDEKLRFLYTNMSLRDVAEQRSPLSVLFADALADNTPLQNLVKKYITQDILDAVAAEHAKGRILLVGTTNLDARRPVIWNLTKIAASGRPAALELFRALLVASTAIPGTFPPVMIDVEVDHSTFRRCTSTGVQWPRCSSIHRPFVSKNWRRSMGYSASESSTSFAMPASTLSGRRWTAGCYPSP